MYFRLPRENPFRSGNQLFEDGDVVVVRKGDNSTRLEP